MNAMPLFLLPLALLSAEERFAASGVELTIRPHTDRIVFGDPLYVEVELVNRGEAPVSGPPPDLEVGTLAFTISHSETRLSYLHSVGGAGGSEPVVFEPGKPVKYYCYFFFPRFHLFDHPFWKLFRGGGLVSVGASYGFHPGISLKSRSHDVRIVPRPESENASLGYWTSAEFENPVKGFQPADFGIHFHSPLNREQMHRLAFDVVSGELGDLFHLSAQFRELYELPPEGREAANRALIERLKEEPKMKGSEGSYLVMSPEGGLERIRYDAEVKRQVLLRKLRSLAGGYNMSSTFEALGGGDRDIPELVPEGVWSEKAPGAVSGLQIRSRPTPAREGVAGSNLEITIFPHAKQIVFGDPLYVEVTIANRGKEAFSASPASQKRFGVVLRVGDGDVKLEAILYPRGQSPPERIEPGESVKLYLYALLPDWYQLDNPFWKRAREGRLLTVRGAYRLTADGVEITSRLHDVLVMPRQENEIAALGAWINADGEGLPSEFGPGHFGIMFRTALSRDQIRRLSLDVPSGELGDLFHLSLQFRDLYESPPEAREAANRELVAWLRKQPDVKREVLARELHNLAASYNKWNMWSTVRAIEKAFAGIKPLTGPDQE